jgi:ribosomal-protein-alanine N-acetyltransferase
MALALRDYREGDIEALFGLDQQCFPPGISYSRLELAAYIGSPATFTLVAEDKARAVPIVGFLVAAVQGRGVGHVITIDVALGTRQMGVGSTLLRAAEQRFRAGRCHKMRLEAAVDNSAALAFYEGHGFVVVKTLRRYYSNGGDAFVLEKRME